MKILACLLLLGGAASASHASDYGCKVLLCLSNPQSNGGPLGVAECTEPIHQLYSDLRKGRPFPSCDLADGNDGRSYARRVYDPYDPCPAPLQPIQSGAIVVQGTRRATNGYPGRAYADFALSGDPAMSGQQLGDNWSPGPRACVGKPTGNYQVGAVDDSYTVSVFDRVVWQQPQSPQAIDIYIDNQLYQRVRY